MNVFLVFICVYVLLVFVLSIVKERKRVKEVNSMTMDKFKEKYEELCTRKNGEALYRFMKRHLCFVVKHSAEIEEYLKGVSVPYPLNNK